MHLQSAIGINTDGVIAGDVDWRGAALVFLAPAGQPGRAVHGAGASRISRTAPRTRTAATRGDQGVDPLRGDRMHPACGPRTSRPVGR